MRRTSMDHQLVQCLRAAHHALRRLCKARPLFPLEQVLPPWRFKRENGVLCVYVLNVRREHQH
jgi:hypothetical protein